MILIVLLLLALYPAAPQAQQSASERMAARLRQLASEVRAQVPTTLNTLNMNAASAAYLREQLANAQNHNRQQALRLELAIQLLRADQTHEAIAELHILQAQDLPPALRPRVRDRLGLAYLRLGEQENCLLHHTIASCLLPIQGEGIHTLQEGSQAAIEQYTAALREDPDNLSARWLLNIAYMTLGQYPHAVPPEWLVSPDCFADSSTIGRFADRAPGLGLDVIALSGSSIVDDFDNDGYLDVVASSWGLDDQLRYFRNQGDGTFAERTEQAGLTGQVGGLNICQADYDDDGDPDLYLSRLGQDNVLYRNEGPREPFADATAEAGVAEPQGSFPTWFWDYDNDGDLDNDGDQDIYIVLGGAYDGDFYQNVLFENPGHGHRWLTRRLEGVQSNRDALGTRIRAKGIVRDIYATVGSGGSFGASSLQQEIGLGRADTLLFVEVTWPTTGQKQRFSNLAMDQIVRIREGATAPIPIHLNRLSLSSSAH